MSDFEIKLNQVPIAKAVVFLLSDDSVPVTGSVIDWDQQPLNCWD